MDSFTPQRLAQLRCGGNRPFLQWMKKHNIITTSIKEKYNSFEASLYREKFAAEAAGQSWRHPTAAEFQQRRVQFDQENAARAARLAQIGSMSMSSPAAQMNARAGARKDDGDFLGALSDGFSKLTAAARDKLSTIDTASLGDEVSFNR